MLLYIHLKRLCLCLDFMCFVDLLFSNLSCVIRYRLRDLRSGELVGTDKAGNKYFQNDNYFFGKILYA